MSVSKKGVLAIVLCVSILCLVLPATSVFATSVGKTCSKAGAIAGTKKNPLVCRKIGRELVWLKVVVARAKTTAVVSTTTTTIPSPIVTNVEQCKILEKKTNQGGSLGFPKVATRVRSTGKVQVGVLFADFPDLPATNTTEEILKKFSPNVEKIYGNMSYGRLTVELRPVHSWVRMQKESLLYRVGRGDWNYSYFLQMLEEIIRVGTQGVDTSMWESFIVVTDSRNFMTTAFSPSPGAKVEAGGRSWANGVVLGGDYIDNRIPIEVILAHEMGHTFGLPDLYPYSGTGFRYTGHFGLMGNIYDSVLELFAWERWVLNWLDDTQVVCLTSGNVKAVLNSVSNYGGQKMIVSPIGDTKALVVEVRRRGGYDTALTEEGPLVYVVDTNQNNGYGGIKVLPINELDGDKTSAPLNLGETIEYEGISVLYNSRSSYGDQITVSRS